MSRTKTNWAKKYWDLSDQEAARVANNPHNVDFNIVSPQDKGKLHEAQDRAIKKLEIDRILKERSKVGEKEQ